MVYCFYMLVLNFFLAGYIVLLIAVVVNVLSTKAGLGSWYEFLKNPKSSKITSIIWLVWAYPLVLGVIAYFAVSVAF